MFDQRKAKKILNQVVRDASIARDADALWSELPSLKRISEKLCWYLSPYIVCDGSNLLSQTIRAAVKEAAGLEDRTAHQVVRVFLQKIKEGVERICCLRISVLDDEKHWSIWSYDEALMEVLEGMERDSIQIRRRSKPVHPGPVEVRVLSYVCTVSDLAVANLELKG